MIDILERNLGMNNQEMWKQCELLKSVVFATIEKEEGRGKAKQIVKTFKYNTPKDVMDRIVNSCEHYKKLYEMENKKVGSLEVVRYKFGYVDGEPKIIIEQVKVLDTEGKYIKFAKLEGVFDFLSKYPITFKKI